MLCTHNGLVVSQSVRQAVSQPVTEGSVLGTHDGLVASQVVSQAVSQLVTEGSGVCTHDGLVGAVVEVSHSIGDVERVA